jgi:hypothetical protein
VDHPTVTSFLDKNLATLAEGSIPRPVLAQQDGVTSNARPQSAAAGPNASPAISLPPPVTNGTPPPSVVTGYGQASLNFVPNVGQTDPSVHFITQHAGFTGFLTDSGMTFEVSQPTATPPKDGSAPPPVVDAFQMQFVGGNPHPEIDTGPELPTRTNYFLGNDPTQWHTDVANYSAVTYQAVWPGIDVVFGPDSSGKFAYDFQVAPGADVSQIRIGWAGLSSTSIDANGNLVLNTPDGPVVQTAPVASQQQGTTATAVAVQQVLSPDGTLSFQVGPYDTTQPLLIDPSVQYSSYLGGSGDDAANGVAVDATGNAHIIGRTSSTNFPSSLGSLGGGSLGGYDVFVTKVSNSGAVLWSTLLGGPNYDYGYGIAVDAAGDSYITGTACSGFPTVNPLAGQSFWSSSYSDGFVS